MYLSWAAHYEGDSDSEYFDVLIPRVIRRLAKGGKQLVDVPDRPALRIGRSDRTVQAVAAEACAARSAFHLLFIHADAGGRGLEAALANRSGAYCQAMHERCKYSLARCIRMTPRLEMEAWALSDPTAVLSALGYRGNPADLQLPADAQAAEAEVDPKSVLRSAVRRARGSRRRRSAPPLAAIAQNQSIDALDRSISFKAFLQNLQEGLQDLGVLHH